MNKASVISNERQRWTYLQVLEVRECSMTWYTKNVFITNLVRVEVRIEDDYSVGGPEIDTDAASACGQKIYENVRVGLIEFVHAFLPHRLLCVPILSITVSIRHSSSSPCEYLPGAGT